MWSPVSANKHLSAIRQTKKNSLVEVRTETQDPNQLHVDSFLRSQASLIKEMVVKLMEEANEEAEHKGWCDTEL